MAINAAMLIFMPKNFKSLMKVLLNYVPAFVLAQEVMR